MSEKDEGMNRLCAYKRNPYDYNTIMPIITYQQLLHYCHYAKTKVELGRVS